MAQAKSGSGAGLSRAHSWKKAESWRKGSDPAGQTGTSEAGSRPSIQDALDTANMLRKRAGMTTMAEILARGHQPNTLFREQIGQWSHESPDTWKADHTQRFAYFIENMERQSAATEKAVAGSGSEAPGSPERISAHASPFCDIPGCLGLPSMAQASAAAVAAADGRARLVAPAVKGQAYEHDENKQHDQFQGHLNQLLTFTTTEDAEGQWMDNWRKQRHNPPQHSLTALEASLQRPKSRVSDGYTTQSPSSQASITSQHGAPAWSSGGSPLAASLTAHAFNPHAPRTLQQRRRQTTGAESPCLSTSSSHGYAPARSNQSSTTSQRQGNAAPWAHGPSSMGAMIGVVPNSPIRHAMTANGAQEGSAASQQLPEGDVGHSLHGFARASAPAGQPSSRRASLDRGMAAQVGRAGPASATQDAWAARSAAAARAEAAYQHEQQLMMNKIMRLQDHTRLRDEASQDALDFAHDAPLSPDRYGAQTSSHSISPVASGDDPVLYRMASQHSAPQPQSKNAVDSRGGVMPDPRVSDPQDIMLEQTRIVYNGAADHAAAPHPHPPSMQHRHAPSPRQQLGNRNILGSGASFTFAAPWGHAASGPGLSAANGDDMELVPRALSWSTSSLVPTRHAHAATHIRIPSGLLTKPPPELAIYEEADESYGLDHLDSHRTHSSSRSSISGSRRMSAVMCGSNCGTASPRSMRSVIMPAVVGGPAGLSGTGNGAPLSAGRHSSILEDNKCEGSGRVLYSHAGKSTVRLSLNGMGPVSANWLLSGDLAQQAAAAAGGGLLPGSQAAQLAKEMADLQDCLRDRQPRHTPSPSPAAEMARRPTGGSS